jgi:alcohol dehydrogenase class IV
VMLPHFARLMGPRAPRALAAFAERIGGAGAPEEIASLSARCGFTTLSSLGVEDEHLPQVAAAVPHHPAYANTPNPPTEDELLALLREAL